MELDNKEVVKLDNKKVFETLNIKKIWIPILVGLGVIIYLFVSDPDIKINQLTLVKDANWFYILSTLALIVLRDWGYMYRLRLLTHHNLSWIACFYVVILWEFSSAVTPSVVGGTFIAVYLLFKEGIGLSKSLAYVMITAIFDNLFFVIFAPLGFLSARNYLGAGLQWSTSIDFLFWIGHAITLIYTLLSAFALFIKPTFFKWLLVKVTAIKFLSRWKASAIKEGDDIIAASSTLKGKKNSYWVKIMLITTLIWAARYSVMNMLMGAYIHISPLEHILIFGKQVIMWVIMLLSPTPGSSGTAEFFFKQFYGDLLGNYLLITAILWRTITYYFYLIAGVLILPRWLKRIFATDKKYPLNEIDDLTNETLNKIEKIGTLPYSLKESSKSFSPSSSSSITPSNTSEIKF